MALVGVELQTLVSEPDLVSDLYRFLETKKLQNALK